MRGTFQKSVKEIVKDATRVFDQVIGFGRITGSSLGAKNGSILFDVEGLGFAESLPGDPNITTSNAEQRGQQEYYSAIGLVARPPKKKAGDDEDLLLQSLTLRVSDGLIPFAFRDQRIMEWLNKGGEKTVPKDGQVAIAGYGGSFLSFETIDENNGPTNICVLYCPYARNGAGVPQKAHMIMLDPTSGNESIAIVHASGLAITMTEADGIVLRGGQTTRLVIKDGSISATAASVALQGNVALGGNPSTALPFAGGPAMLPSASVFLSTP
jgi:hypothetical protein